MLTRADHPKSTSYKQFHMNMVTGERKEESNKSINESEFHSQSNSDSESDECCLRLVITITEEGITALLIRNLMLQHL